MRENGSSARSMERIERTANEYSFLAQIGQIISSTLYIDDIYEKFAETARKLIPFDRISITLTYEKKNLFTLSYVSGVDIPDKRKGMSRPLADTMSDEVRRTRKSWLFNPRSVDEVRKKFPSIVSNYEVGLKSYLSMPLLYKNEVIGVLHLRSLREGFYKKGDMRLAQAIANQIAGAIANAQLFTEHERTLKELRARQKELKSKSENLEEMNAALKVLLKSVEERNNEASEKILLNIRELLLPYIQKMKSNKHNRDIYLEIIEQNLSEISSSFLFNINNKFSGFTPREIEIAHLIKGRKTSKEIASILGVSVRTVNFHRNSLRKKFHLNGKQNNLTSYLITLD